MIQRPPLLNNVRQQVQMSPGQVVKGAIQQEHLDRMGLRRVRVHFFCLDCSNLNQRVAQVLHQLALIFVISDYFSDQLPAKSSDLSELDAVVSVHCISVQVSHLQISQFNARTIAHIHSGP
ncbi:hypothetical protein BpHYR1_012880 [Brachionus plicatilis]|uniref:Uncharacterized protein n=1 Tax=Brachionus plicatilis TaxID=10195 RepID=A0A3M7QG53_BRAPC|nr:hypothetical protein BpHYR1_012880 [Brachionus plicatilis]